MNILHISDLHFGKHNTSLAKDLLNRVRKIKPDLILCTGDVVDTPDTRLFKDACDYLGYLEGACAGQPAPNPSLIVIPGNHDILGKGIWFRDGKNRFGSSFADDAKDYFFQQSGVWVFGFDSATEGETGGGGRVRIEDLERFHESYLALENQPGFREAFKIVAVHHHPLPVNWDTDWKQKWLTMTNAGAFLSAVLTRGVHLILHGHEHLQARAQLSSTLGGPDGSQITVVSLGATLRTVDNPNRNWFSLIKIGNPGVTVEFFPSQGLTFAPKPESALVLRSSASQKAELFGAVSATKGYYIERMVSYSVITPDGDCKRIVECENLRRTGERDPFEGGLPVKIPYTSGYLDKLRIDRPNLTLGGLPAREQRKDFQSTIGGSLDGVSFPFSWYAVNSYAMDTAQFALHYAPEAVSGSDKTEFTHVPVEHPIEELTVVVQFPAGFKPEGRPEPRVSRTADGSPRTWKPVPDLENELRASRALRFYESMNVASLRVLYPQMGVSYGIQWQVPEAPKKTGKSGRSERQLQEFRKRWATGKRTEDERAALLNLLAFQVEAARMDLMDEWDGKLEVSFLFFDLASRCLAPVQIGTSEGKEIREVPYGGFQLGYGMGIAGRAFKANRIRIYAPREGVDSEEPDYYYYDAGCPPHAVLACIPVQIPETSEFGPYGVFCLGSERYDCPLAYLDEGDVEKPLDRFLGSLNHQILKGFAEIYLGAKPAPPLTSEQKGG